MRGGANGGVGEGWGRGEEQDIRPARQGAADISRIEDSDYAHPTNGCGTRQLTPPLRAIKASSECPFALTVVGPANF